MGKTLGYAQTIITTNINSVLHKLLRKGTISKEMYICAYKNISVSQKKCTRKCSKNLCTQNLILGTLYLYVPSCATRWILTISLALLHYFIYTKFSSGKWSVNDLAVCMSRFMPYFMLYFLCLTFLSINYIFFVGFSIID